MKRPKLIPEFKDIPSPRQPMPELSLEERRLNFREVELGYTEEMALKEASRCLSCRRCIGCGLCLAECKEQAIVYDQSQEVVTIQADQLIYTGDGVIYKPAEDWLGYTKFANVITSYELERLLSPTGPFGGYVLRLSDGEVPSAICFIQCVGSRTMGAEYCSTECCRTTLLQVRRLHELVSDVKISIFHKGLRPCGRDGEVLLKEVEDSQWVELIEEDVKEVTETQEGRLIVSFGEGGSAKEFDLVVLAVGIRPSPEIRKLSVLRSKTNRFGFLNCNLKDLLMGLSSVGVAGRVCGLMENQYALLVARSAGGLNASFDQKSERKPLGGKSILVMGCRYGFKNTGDGDLEQIMKRIEKENEDAVIGGIYQFLCHGEGRTELTKRAKDASRVVIVGCHPGNQEETFAEVLNTNRDCITILSAEDARGYTLKQVVSSSSSAQTRGKRGKDIVIVGSGISGLAAASVLVDHDVTVHLVEKMAQVGGNLERVAKASGVESSVVEAFLDRIRNATNLRIYRDARVEGFEKMGAGYRLSIGSGGRSVQVDCVALLIATGPKRYSPEKYGYGSIPNVITQDEFYQRLSSGSLGAERIVMIQCVGARDEHPHCSRYCCPQALNNAIRCKTEFPETEIAILHRGLRLFGFDESLYSEAVEKGIEFIQTSGKITITGEKPLKVRGKDGRGKKGDIDIDASLAVLSVGHCHTSTYSILNETFGVELDEFGFVRTCGTCFNSHRTSLDGVYVCGFARQPMVAEYAFIDGLAAGLTILGDLGG